MSVFTEQEVAIIDMVCDQMESLSVHAISELSHHELAWKKHLHQAATIPYDEAFGLVGNRQGVPAPSVSAVWMCKRMRRGGIWKIFFANKRVLRRVASFSLFSECQ